MATVLLVRHGRTQANVDGVLAGRSPGVFLDSTGEEQAAAVAERLATLRLAAIVASPLDRTQQTADAIGARQPVAVERHTDEDLSECHYGEWTGQPIKALAKEPLWATVQAHPSAAAFPAGESMTQMLHRSVGAVRRWNARLGDDAVYAVVSHGDVIKAILADALGMHLDLFQRIVVDPCSVSVVRYTAHRPFVVRMNDTGGDLSGLAVRARRRRTRASDAVIGGGAGDG